MRTEHLTRTEQLTVFVCEICGAQYSDKYCANICESQGVEKLLFKVGDFCLLEKRVPTKIMWFTRYKWTVVMAQIIKINKPHILNPRPPGCWMSGTHQYMFYVRFNNFDKPLPADIDVNDINPYEQGRLLPLDRADGIASDLPSTREFGEAICRCYDHAYQRCSFLKEKDADKESAEE